MQAVSVVPKVDFLRFFKNYFSSVLVAYCALIFYTKISVFHLNLYSASWVFQTANWKFSYLITTSKTLEIIFWFYVAFIFIKCAISDEMHTKCYYVVTSIFTFCTGHRLTHIEKQACLQTLLKFLFLPFVINILIADSRFLNFKVVDFYIYYFLDPVQRDFMIPNLIDAIFRVLFTVVYMFDVVPFVVGYLTDSKLLGNRVKSVDSTVLGWVVCFLCYAPFNTALSAFFPTVIPEHILPFVDYPYLNYVLLFVALILLGGYASASVSMGWKASNLSSRGLVQSGLYRYIRHPAYACKNAAWWVLCLSWAAHQYIEGKPFLFSVFALVVWTFIYYMRAITEERHLLSTDTEYLDYCKRVPCRFIPNRF
jgi:protein-S-isoprenylcysteine O-methyltransferase Ste14